MLATAVLFADAATGAEPPRVALLRTWTASANQQQRLSVHALPATGAISLAAALASDETFHPQASKSPTRALFAGDANGDGKDELFEVRSKSTDPLGTYTLRSFFAPTTYEGSIGPVLATAKKGTLGTSLGVPAILAMGAGDMDDDGRDDALIALATEGGTLAIEVRKLPKKKDASMTAVKASLVGLGSTSSDTILAVAGVDFDGDDAEEIALLRRTNGSSFSLEVYSAPTTIGETPTLRGSYVAIDTLALGIPATLSRIQNDGDVRDELLIGFRLGASLRSIAIHELPVAVGLTLPDPVFQDTSLFSSTEPLTAALALRGHALALPPSDLSGPWTAHFEHLAGGTPETHDVSSGMQANQTGTLISLLLPVFNVAQANYTQSAPSLVFVTQNVSFTSPTNGSKYVFQFGSGLVVAGENSTFITGTYTGKKMLPLGQEAVVTAGNYRFVIPD